MRSSPPPPIRVSSGFKATAFLSDAHARPTGKITVPCPEQNAAALAKALAEQLVGVGPAAPNSGINAKAEAARFGAEAAFQLSHGQFAHAATTAEAACALNPGSVAYHALLAEALIKYGEAIDVAATNRQTPQPTHEQAIA